MQVLLAIPVYNEVEHVEQVVEQARRYMAHILLVDDGSTDGSSELLGRLENVRIIRHPKNMGYGQSLIDAFDYAAEHGFDWIITMDCDGQHEPGFIPDFLGMAAADDWDIVSGSRYLRHELRTDSPPPDRRAINADITHSLNDRLGLDLTDAFCGFKAYRVDALARLDLTEPGYAMPLQLWAQAARRGLRIREIPVRLIYNDPNRSFGGQLDQADYRRHHYLDVFEEAMAVEDRREACARGCRCR